MIRKVMLILATLIATGLFASGCYEAKQHLLETSEYVRVLVLDDDGMGTRAQIK